MGITHRNVRLGICQCFANYMLVDVCTLECRSFGTKFSCIVVCMYVHNSNNVPTGKVSGLYNFIQM